MFKVVLFSLVLGLISNAAFADCLSQYQAARDSLKNNTTGMGSGAITTGAVVASHFKGVNIKVRKYKIDAGNAISSAVVVGAGVSTARNYITISELNTILALLREAQVGNGLYLARFSREVNEKSRMSEISSIITALDHNELLCGENGLLSEGEIVELVRANLK